MEKITLLFSLLFLSMSVLLQAQNPITQIADGEYKFAKGAILVSLADTVSPDFIEYQFERMGLEILKTDIFPVRGYFEFNLSPDNMNALSSHPYIKEIQIPESEFLEKPFLEMVKRQKMSPEDSLLSRKVFESMAENPIKYIVFHHYVTEEMAITFNETIPEIGMRISMTPPKSVIIKTAVDKETQTMKQIELLSYVESTAFIMLENEQ